MNAYNYKINKVFSSLLYGSCDEFQVNYSIYECSSTIEFYNKDGGSYEIALSYRPSSCSKLYSDHLRVVPVMPKDSTITSSSFISGTALFTPTVTNPDYELVFTIRINGLEQIVQFDNKQDFDDAVETFKYKVEKLYNETMDSIISRFKA